LGLFLQPATKTGGLTLNKDAPLHVRCCAPFSVPGHFRLQQEFIFTRENCGAVKFLLEIYTKGLTGNVCVKNKYFFCSSLNSGDYDLGKNNGIEIKIKCCFNTNKERLNKSVKVYGKKWFFV
jgi:hypothetical protein